MNGAQLVGGEICEKYYFMYECIGITWTGANAPPLIYFVSKNVFF
jgi:hypothetical protein